MMNRTILEAKLAAIDQRRAAALQALQRQRSKLKAQLAAFNRPTKSQRRLDARRKILLGAFVVEQLEHAGQSPQALSFQGKRFFDWLVRPTDRALFGDESPVSIQPSPPPPPATVADTPNASLRCDDPQQDVLAGKNKRRAKPRALADGKKTSRRKRHPPIV
jgi:hypothetical protein